MTDNLNAKTRFFQNKFVYSCTECALALHFFNVYSMSDTIVYNIPRFSDELELGKKNFEFSENRISRKKNQF